MRAERRRCSSLAAWFRGAIPLLAALAACSTSESRAHDLPAPDLEPAGDIRARLAAARDRWEKSGIDDYELTLLRVCFCPPEFRGPVGVTVADGIVVARRYAESGAPVPVDRAQWFPAVEGLFEILEDAVTGGAHSVTATFDAETGHPVESFVDDRMDVTDEEVGYTIQSLDVR